MRINQPHSQHRIRSMSTLITLFVFVFLGCSQKALGQWTTNGNDINSTNSGNVGIGTTSPLVKFHLQTASTAQARIEATSAAAAALDFKNPSRRWVIGAGLLAGGGDFSIYDANTALTRMFFDTSGNVGIGTTNPLYSLDVNGGVNGFRAKAATVSSNDVIATFENTNGIQAIVRGNGYVGLGTASPKARLDIKQAEDSFLGGIHLRRSTTNDTWAVATGTDNNLYMGYATNASGADAAADFTVYPLVLSTNGRVGIGTPAPTTSLDVAGQIRSSTGGFKFPDGTVQTSAAGGGGGVTSFIGRTGAVVAASNDYTWAQINKTTSSLADLTTRSAGDLSSGTLPDARFPTTLPAASGANLTALNASSLASGTVATARLGSGTANATTFLRGDNTWAVPTGSGAVDSVFGRTGAVVAATNDYTWAQINKTTSSLADLTTRSAGDLSSGTVATARLGTGTADATTFLRGDNTWAAVTSSQWNTSGSNINYASGNVGIGIGTPTEKLHVVGNGKVTGNLTVDGNIAAKYQDMAEWVPAAHALPAGTVTVLDPQQSNQVMASVQAYDTRVAGVISEQPGIVLGEAGSNKVLVATTGRVRVKVDATRGPIRIGDLLVTSDIAGMAMKSEPLSLGGVAIHRPGTLIGKALEPLDKGTGTILVLLSLQ